MRALACIAVVASLVGTARADVRKAEDLTIFDERSENVATALTVAGIVVPIAIVGNAMRPGYVGGDGPVMLAGLVSPALIIGPSIGNWYARNFGAPGLATRLGGAILTIAGYQLVQDAKRCARGEVVTDGCHSSDRSVGLYSMAMGATLVVGSWAYDLIESRRHARLHNWRRKAQLVPVVSPTSAGVAFGASF